MNRSSVVALMLLCAAVPAWGQTLYDGRDTQKSIRSYAQSITGKRQMLYSGDKSVRRNTFEAVEKSMASPVVDGDAVFPLGILGDFVIAVGAPSGSKPDKGTQEDALTMIRKMAANSDLPLTSRELAIQQLARIAMADKLADFDWNETAVKALVSLSEDKNYVLAQSAMVALSGVAAKGGKDWKDLSNSAAKAITGRLQDKDSMIQRAAFMETIRALRTAPEMNNAAERMWDELSDQLDEIRSPAIQDEIRASATALVNERQGSVFAKPAASTKKSLDKLEPVKKTARAPVPELLASLKDMSNPADLEAALAKIEQEVASDRSRQALAFSVFASLATNPEITSYTLARLTDSLITIARDTGSPLMFHRTAASLLGLAVIHGNSPRATVPLTQMARLLASTDQPGLVIPALDEVRDMALSALPMWINRRMVGILFLQAGDSPNAEVRQYAAQQLARIGMESRNWALRYEALTRADQLEKLSTDPQVKFVAAKLN